LEGWEFSEWLFVCRELRFEPSERIENLRIWIKALFSVNGPKIVRTYDDARYQGVEVSVPLICMYVDSGGEEVAVIYVVFGKLVGNTFMNLVSNKR
jgi:hypothetical protein